MKPTTARAQRRRASPAARARGVRRRWHRRGARSAGRHRVQVAASPPVAAGRVRVAAQSARVGSDRRMRRRSMVLLVMLDPAPEPDLRPPGRRGRRPGRRRVDVELPPLGRATVPDRGGDRPPGRLRGLRAPALRPGRPARPDHRNAPGTVDAGYRGEIRVTLLNTDPVSPASVWSAATGSPSSSCSGCRGRGSCGPSACRGRTAATAGSGRRAAGGPPATRPVRWTPTRASGLSPRSGGMSRGVVPQDARGRPRRDR